MSSTRWSRAPKSDLKMSSTGHLISGWAQTRKAEKTISTLRQLSLSACDAAAYRDQQNAVKSIWEIPNFAEYKSAVKEFVILWFVRLANLSETDFQKLFWQQICPRKISHSQMNFDATLLSICSFCNIWYRSLSNFYSATAKHTMYDGVLWWSIHEEVLLQIFTFWFKFFHQTFLLIQPTMMQDILLKHTRDVFSFTKSNDFWEIS